MIKILNDINLIKPLYKIYLEIRYPNLSFNLDLFLDLLYTKNYIAFVYYKDDEPISFIDGVIINDDVFEIHNVLKNTSTSKQIYKLFLFFENYLKQHGYKHWISKSTNDTKELVQKLGAKEL